MDHQFDGPPFTIGIEEELMILDANTLELVNAIERLLEASPAGEIKPELMESVLEVSTEPCRNTAQAGEQLRALRAAGDGDRGVQETSRSAPPARTRSRCGRTSGSWPVRATAT